MEKVMVKQVVLLEPTEIHSGVNPPCSPWRIPWQRRWIYPEENCSLWRAPGRNCSKSCSSWGTHGGTVCCFSTVPCGDNHTGAVCEELCPVEQTCWGRKKLWKERGARSTVFMNWWQPPSHCALQGGRVGSEAVKLSFGKKVALVLSLFLIILLRF